MVRFLDESEVTDYMRDCYFECKLQVAMVM